MWYLLAGQFASVIPGTMTICVKRPIPLPCRSSCTRCSTGSSSKSILLHPIPIPNGRSTRHTPRCLALILAGWWCPLTWTLAWPRVAPPWISTLQPFTLQVRYFLCFPLSWLLNWSVSVKLLCFTDLNSVQTLVLAGCDWPSLGMRKSWFPWELVGKQRRLGARTPACPSAALQWEIFPNRFGALAGVKAGLAPWSRVWELLESCEILIDPLQETWWRNPVVLELCASSTFLPCYWSSEVRI